MAGGKCHSPPGGHRANTSLHQSKRVSAFWNSSESDPQFQKEAKKLQNTTAKISCVPDTPGKTEARNPPSTTSRFFQRYPRCLQQLLLMGATWRKLNTQLKNDHKTYIPRCCCLPYGKEMKGPDRCRPGQSVFKVWHVHWLYSLH